MESNDNALRISRAPEQTILQAENIVRELRGIRANPKPAAVEGVSDVEAITGTRQMTLHISNIDRKIENFNKLVQFLTGVAEYKPKISFWSQKSAVQRESAVMYFLK